MATRFVPDGLDVVTSTKKLQGAIVARFVFDDTSLCFINCHLAAGQSHSRQRNQDIAAILEDGEALPRSEVPGALAYAGGGDGTMIMDHEIVFVCCIPIFDWLKLTKRKRSSTVILIIELTFVVMR